MAHYVLTGPVFSRDFESDNHLSTTWEKLEPQRFFTECYDRCNYDDNFPSQDGDTYGRPGKGIEVVNVQGAWCVPGPDADPSMKGDV